SGHFGRVTAKLRGDVSGNEAARAGLSRRGPRWLLAGRLVLLDPVLLIPLARLRFLRLFLLWLRLGVRRPFLERLLPFLVSSEPEESVIDRLARVNLPGREPVVLRVLPVEVDRHGQ